MTLMQKFTGIYYQPGRVFEDLREKPIWLAPLLIAILLSAAAIYITWPVVSPEIIAEVSKNPNIQPEQMEAIQQRLQNPWLGMINPVVGTGLAMLVMTLVFWGVFAMLGGKATFKLTFTAVVWSWMVKIPELIIKVPLMLVQETARVHTSLAILLPEDADQGFLFRLLAKVDIFNLWTVVLLGLGCSIFTGVDRKKAYWAAFAVWALWVLLSSSLGGMLRPGG